MSKHRGSFPAEITLEFIRLGYSDRDGMNLLTNRGIISDHAIWPQDLSWDDSVTALSWLATQQPDGK